MQNDRGQETSQNTQQQEQTQRNTANEVGAKQQRDSNREEAEQKQRVAQEEIGKSKTALYQATLAHATVNNSRQVQKIRRYQPSERVCRDLLKIYSSPANPQPARGLYRER